MDGPGLGSLPSGYPPASLRSSLEEEATGVRAQAGGGTQLQHIVAALLLADRILVQPRAEWDARHLGIGALQVGSWQRWKRQERGMFQSTSSPGRHADPCEIPALPHNDLGGFGQVT